MMNKIKQFLYRTLVFLRVIDDFDGNVSITNVALMIVLYKLVTAQQASLVDTGSLMIALSHYGFKKFLNKDNINSATKIATQIVEKTESISQEEKD